MRFPIRAARTEFQTTRALPLDHFPAKLLTLARGFRTATGRRLAEKRHRAIEHFYREMLEEVSVTV